MSFIIARPGSLVEFPTEADAVAQALKYTKTGAAMQVYEVTPKRRFAPVDPTPKKA